MVVLGIDRGVGSCGHGVVVGRGRRLRAGDGGVIEAPAVQPPGRRLAILRERIADGVDEHGPGAVAREALCFGENVGTVFAVRRARGVVLVAGGQRSVACVDCMPRRVTGAGCGAGLVDEGQVVRMVRGLLWLPAAPRPDDAADAVAVAIGHADLVPLAADAAAG